MAEKYSVHRFTGNGSRTDWEFNFTGGFIANADVKASVRSVTNLEVATDFDWVGPNTIRIVPPVANGLRLTIYRDTPKILPLVDFVDGAIINEKNLDTNARQAIFAVAEMVDAFADVNDNSAAAIVTANLALATANAATQTSNAALNAAQGAVNTANAASAVAALASGKSDVAVATANSANTKADGAIATANAANTTAGQANSKADGAVAQAATAAQTAAQANVNSSGAVTTANDAKARAINAQEVAGAATVTATGAKTTADATASQFEDLRDTVEEIAGGDLSNFVRVNQVNDFTADQRFGFGMLTLKGAVGGRDMQIASRNDGDIPLWRRTNNDGTMGSWAPMPTLWSAIVDKPTQFPPSIHGHTVADTVGLQAALDAKLNGTNPAFAGTLGGNNVLVERLITNAGGVGWRHKDANGAGGYGFLSYKDSSHFYMLLTNKDDANGSFNNLRPFRVDLSNGYVGIANGLSVTGGLTVDAMSVGGYGVWTSGNFNPDTYVSKSLTHLGFTGGGPLINLSWQDFAARPTGFTTMTLPESTINPLATYGYVFKHGRRDAGNGWGGTWITHAQSAGDAVRAFFGGTPNDATAPTWTEAWTKANLPKPVPTENSDGGGHNVTFGWSGSFFTANVNGVVRHYFQPRDQDANFRDITATRGDGSGVIYLGGGAYLYHDGTQYHLAGEKDFNTSGNVRAGKRLVSYGRWVPQTYISAGDPGDVGGQVRDGDIWIIP